MTNMLELALYGPRGEFRRPSAEQVAALSPADRARYARVEVKIDAAEAATARVAAAEASLAAATEEQKAAAAGLVAAVPRTTRIDELKWIIASKRR
jgi:hypothetical protein